VGVSYWVTFPEYLLVIACVGTNIVSHACHNFVFVFAIFSGMLVFITWELQPVFCRLRSESGMKLIVTGVMDMWLILKIEYGACLYRSLV